MLKAKLILTPINDKEYHKSIKAVEVIDQS